MAELTTDVRWIKGIGEKRAAGLKKLGINTLSDLVSYFPRAYDDRTVFKKINELTIGENACVIAVAAAEPTLSHIRAGMDIVKLRAVDEAGSLNITFFNQSYMKQNIRAGETYVFYGRVGGTFLRPEMTNPIVERESAVRRFTGRIVPIYRLTAGISQAMIASAVIQGLEACGDLLPDPLPDGVRQKYKLAQSRFAYETVHFPNSFEELEIARRRLIFEELYVLSCAMTFLKGSRRAADGNAFSDTDARDFIKNLPFSPTAAQSRAIDEALGDMAKAVPMSRLVQGDVGSGKTVVAAACCYSAFKSGYQAAMMAPTEILARQHYKTLTDMLGAHGINVGILIGSMTAKEKKVVIQGLVSGEIDVIVGTHAIISDGVEFKALGLVITDEQHRFGVNQRTALAGKGNCPHVLVMSATPIPRTLALIVYGDLDISVIDELPPGRQTVDTFAVTEKLRGRVNNFIRKQILEGGQAYIVCPMVEDGETSDGSIKSVKKYAENLEKNVFPDLKAALVHGKLKPKEKEKVMAGFAAGDYDILVATTVIEVGVDVPNANLMVIENADRFGLSQLHQLRGRVGRGSRKSYCILFETTGNEQSEKRLKVMCETNDGFKISEADLKMRGPGDFFGSRQHGLPEMKIANFASDMEVLQTAQAAAKETIAEDRRLSLPKNQRLRKYIDKMLEDSVKTLS